MFDIAALERETARVLREHDRAQNLALNEAGYQAFQEASRDVPRDTGALARETRYRVVRTSGGRLLRLENKKPYAAAQDKGSRPHRIAGNPWLYFKASNGSLIRTRSVNHPGTKPTYFLRNAATNAYDSVGDRYTRHMLAALRR